MNLNINTNAIRNAAGPRINMAALKVQHYSPELMVGSGILSGILAAILLARAYKRQDETLGETLNQIRDEKEQIAENNEVYSGLRPEDQEDLIYITKRQEFIRLRHLYLQGTGDFFKLYGPPIALGLFSISMVVGSHGIMKNRNKALFAAMTVIQRGFAAYRERVRDELGEDADRRFYYDLTKRNTVTVEVDPETGKKKKIKGEENVIGEDLTPKMYQRLFDSTNPNWGNSVRSDHFWLGTVQQMIKERLDRRGYVLLNDAYKALGFPETPEGAVVGWSLAKVQAEGVGDDYIDFGICEPWNDNRRDGAILLDFNVNGSVYEWIGADWKLNDGLL